MVWGVNPNEFRIKFSRKVWARVMATSSSKLAKSIKETLMKVEETCGVPADNPALLSLKKIFRRRIHELESARDPDHPPFPDWTRGHRRCRFNRASGSSS